MLIARRDMTLNNQPVVVGQVLDGIWPTLRVLAQRNLLRQRWVEEIHTDGVTPEVTEVPPPVRKRGRPKGSKNKPKPVARASA